MSWMYVGIVVLGAFFVIFGELIADLRSKKKRALFSQPLPPTEQTVRAFLRTCVAMVAALLTVAFIILSINCSFETPKDGIAVVVDASSISPEKSLGLEKNIAESFMGYCGGVPLSLYELRGGALFSVCPPTIDRIFFKLQLGSLSSVGLVSGNEISLKQIENEVVSKYGTLVPWVVVVSAKRIPSGKKYPNATACISIGKDSVECVLYDASKGVSIRSIDLLAKEIRYRILETQKTNMLNSEQMLMVASCIVIAFLLFLYWKSQWPSLHSMIAIVLLFSCDLFAIDENEANVIMQDVIDLAQGGMLSESEKKTGTLLNITSSPDARARLIYDRALLLYLRGDDTSALNWIRSLESVDVEMSRKRECQTLQGIILIRMLDRYSSPEEYSQRQAALRNWLNAGPLVSADLVDTAQLALMTTRLQEEQSIRFTIHWLQNALIASQGKGGEPFFRCAEGITTVTNGMVQEYLKKFFDQNTIEQFFRDVSSIKNMIELNRVYLWYYLAAAHTVEESVDYLFQEGCTLSNRALYFPFFRKIAETNLPMVRGLLLKIKDSLPLEQSRAFTCLYSGNPETLEMQAVYWYACRALWPTVAEEGAARYKAIAAVLINEMKVPMLLSTKRVLANLSTCITSLLQAPSDCSDPVEFVLGEILEAWYGVDKLGVFEFILTQQKTDVEIWNKRLATLLSNSIQKDSNYSSLCSVIAKVLTKDEMQTFNLNLLAHLWQIGLTRNDTMQLFSLQLYEINSLLKHLHSMLARPSDEVLKTFCLIYQVMPSIMKTLLKGDDYLKGKKKETYDGLFYELISRMKDIQERIAKPAIFRLPKVREEVLASAAIVLQMIALCSETNEEPSSGGGMMTESEYVPGTLRAESAVTLFQELDRSDRELFGD